MEKIKIECPDIQIRLWPFVVCFCCFFSGSYDCWKCLWKLPAFCSVIDVRTRKTVPAVPLERLVSDDMLALRVYWSTVKKTSVVFHIPFADD